MLKILTGRIAHMNFLMDKAGDEGGGGDDKSDADKSKETESSKDDVIADLKSRLEKLEGRQQTDANDEDDDLLTKSKRSREDDDKKKGDTKALEAALRFSMGANDWLKQNSSLLPKEVGEIFEQAKKETYDSEIEKDAAIKAGIVQSFFAVQENLDLLTPSLKNELEDYLKLTKNGKQDKANQIYNMVFEPAFEMLKRERKAKALNKGLGDGSDDHYRDRLIKGSRKHFLGEKQDA